MLWPVSSSTMEQREVVAVKTGVYDWAEISNELAALKRDRQNAEKTASEELARLDETVHTANKHLDGFHFSASEYNGDEDPHSLIRVKLVDTSTGVALPWVYECGYYYSGSRLSYYEDTIGGGREFKETAESGTFSMEDWFAPLAELAKLNLRLTPRPSQSD